jgi:hypothetical protein
MARNIEKGAFRTPPRHQNHRRWVFGEGDHSKRSAIMYDCVEFDDYPGNIGLKRGTS